MKPFLAEALQHHVHSNIFICFWEQLKRQNSVILSFPVLKSVKICSLLEVCKKPQTTPYVPFFCAAFVLFILQCTKLPLESSDRP